VTHSVGDPDVDREVRRKRYALRQALFVVLSMTAVGLRSGVVVAVGVVGAAGGLIFGGMVLVFYFCRRADRKRRLLGSAPSWSASMSSSAYRVSGGTGPGHQVRDMGEVGGRLTLTDDGFSWTPSRRTRRAFSAGPVSWTRDWKPELIPVWGLGRTGRLSLTRADGRQVRLWLRDAPDLAHFLSRRAVG
jgi:hypothetical protein